MRRRQFITLLGGAATWPVAARAQQADRVRRVGVLMNSANGAFGRPRAGAFQQELQRPGWIDDRNIAVEYRWGEDHFAQFAAIVAVHDVTQAAGALGVDADALNPFQDPGPP